MVERSIKAIERQKSVVQEAIEVIEVRPLSLTSLRAARGNRRTRLLVNDGKDEGTKNVRDACGIDNH